MDDTPLGRMEGSIVELRSGLDAVRLELKDVRSEVEALRTDTGAGLDALRTEMRRDMDVLRADMHDRDNRVHVMLEAIREDIRALAPDFAPIRREFQQADAALEDRIENRLVPLETFTRQQAQAPRQKRR